jgi:hypothetical protein
MRHNLCELKKGNALFNFFQIFNNNKLTPLPLSGIGTVKGQCHEIFGFRFFHQTILPGPC